MNLCTHAVFNLGYKVISAVEYDKTSQGVIRKSV